MAMNLAFIRYFLAVAETGGFTAAAERCHVTQPTLSAGIGRLEEEIGARLFDRSRRAGLTAAGQKLLPHARAMVEAWQAARAEQRSAKRPTLVRVAIGSTLPIQAAMGWLAAAQRRLGFEVEISEGTAAVVMERWRRSRCDLALFPTREAVTGDPSVTLLREAYVLAASTDHRIATRDRWTAAELADTPFILRADCEAHDEATRLLAAAGVPPPRRPALGQRGALRRGGARRAGCRFMPRSLLRPGMAAAEIREVALERRVMLAWRGDADPEIAAAVRDAATRTTASPSRARLERCRFREKRRAAWSSLDAHFARRADFFFLVDRQISNAPTGDSLGNRAPHRQRARLRGSQRAHYGQWPPVLPRVCRHFSRANARNRCSARDHAVSRA